MKRLFGIGAGLLLVALAVTAPAFAIPKLLNYQGRLKDNDGLPISGNIQLTFTLYERSSV